jgi:hypothetical protein
MSHDRNKIATELSAEELQGFLGECIKTPCLTLAKVQELAAERGIVVSLMGAKSFRDKTFARHLQRISKTRELADQVSALRHAGAGHTIADAAAAILSDEVLDALVNPDPDAGLDLDTMSKIVQRLRAGDAQVAALKHRIAQDQLDAAKLAIEHAVKIKGITSEKIGTDEKVQRVRELLFGSRPEGVEAIA